MKQDNNKLVIWMVVAIFGVAAFAGVAINTPKDADVSLLNISKNGVNLQLSPPDGKAGVLEVELCELEGKVLGKTTVRHKGLSTAVTITAALDSDDPADYFIRYRFDSSHEYTQRSLFLLSEMLETIVLAQREYLAGTTPIIQILVRDRAAGKPVNGAMVHVTLKDNDDILCVREMKTNWRGQAAVQVKLPDKAIKDVQLTIIATTAVSKDVVEERIQILNGTRTLLTTDKPMYQPGQTIHMRALSLTRPNLMPLQQSSVLFEVEDAKGNKCANTLSWRLGGWLYQSA